MRHTRTHVSFVSTDLHVLAGPGLDPSTNEVTVEGKVYRRLDPTYYAWLRRRMESVKLAAEAGKLSAEAFETLRYRFNAMHELAIEAFGEEALIGAVDHFDPKEYSAPAKRVEAAPTAPAPVAQAIRRRSSKPFSYPEAASPDLPFDRVVTPEALAEVDAIEQAALALGWTEPELYQTRGRFAFPCGQDYGLVTFLNSDHHVGQVTAEAITITSPYGAIQRFYRRSP